MGRAALLNRRLLALPLLVVALAAGTDSDGAHADSDGFRIRMVKLGAPAGSAAATAHLQFSHELGFNALWCYSHQVGRWKSRLAPQGPFLYPEFLELLERCRQSGIRVFVSVNPMADDGRESFEFSNEAHRQRLQGFIDLLRDAGVRDLVLSFDDQPLELSALGDVVTYGRSTAAAQVELVRHVSRHNRGLRSVWFCPATYSDTHFEREEYRAYGDRLLADISRLPRRVGIVWTGPNIISYEITAAELNNARRRFGGRKILLYDNYPVNGDFKQRALGLVLGPLRNRDPALSRAAAAYLACPMVELGASRLPLLTIADYLRRPAAYDPDRSYELAQRRLAGENAETIEALRVQGIEWGGWIDERSYRPADVDNVDTAEADLRDPTALAIWRYVADRYPARIAALEHLDDRTFREELLEVMEARLAVSRALPTIREYRARIRAGRSDVDELRVALSRIREAIGRADAVARYDRFLVVAGAPVTP